MSRTKFYRDNRVLLNVTIGQSVRDAIIEYQKDNDRMRSISEATNELVKRGLKTLDKEYVLVEEW